MGAFIHRINPGGIDKVQEALDSNEILTGWSEARGLLEPGLEWFAFREILRAQYYSEDPTYRRAGLAAGNMWRFIREMQIGDVIAVPGPGNFYVAKITGPARFLEERVQDDSAYRRSVEWLNDKQPIHRAIARAALVSRLKIQGTSAFATDLQPDIEECLRLVVGGQLPTFREDLKQGLITTALEHIRTGRLDDYRFEKLVKEVLLSLGAVSCDIIARSKDKGVDLMATFLVAGALEQRVGVQVKHYYRNERPAGPDVVEQLVTGMEVEGITLGMVVCSGMFSDGAQKAAQETYEQKGYSIELVDGELLASFLVNLGFPDK